MRIVTWRVVAASLVSFGIVAMASTGCSYDSGALGEVTCENTSDCTAVGSECVDGYCVPVDEYDAGEDADPPLDAGPVEDVEPPLDAGEDADPPLDADPVEDADAGCASGEEKCDGECVDPMADDEHCGGCGDECSGVRPICHGGECVECVEAEDCEAGLGCRDDGTCVDCVEDEHCDVGVCTAQWQCVECELADDCEDVPACEEPVCAEESCKSQPICEGTDDECGCESCEDCTADDGWVDDGSAYPCCDGTQACATCQDQIFREYGCDGDECVYEETDERTEKSGCISCGDCSAGICEQTEIFEAESAFDVYLEHQTNCGAQNCASANCEVKTPSENEFGALAVHRTEGEYDGEEMDAEARAFISFDTSTIPAGATIQDATLGVEALGEIEVSAESNSIVVYGGGECIGAEVDDAAWNACGDEIGEFTSGEGWREVSLSGGSLDALVNESGRTQFQIINTAGCPGLNAWGFEPTSGDGPELEVVWEEEP